MGRAPNHSTGPVAVCQACYHPRPVPDSGGTTWAVTNLRSMEIGADESGCVTCGLLSKGFRKVAGCIHDPETSHDSDNRDNLDIGGDDGKVNNERWLRIDFNSAATTPSLELFDFTTSTAVTAFCSKSEYTGIVRLNNQLLLLVGALKLRHP